jgi:SRSO17 transposase
VPRKNVEAMVLRLFGADEDAERRVRALQQFVGEGAWDDEAILARHQSLVEASLGEDEGVFIVDGSDVPKQGKHSAGVARQWCGASGKKDNCQAGVFLGYASRKGYTLLDRRLYLPASWFREDHQELWAKARIPKETRFQTKHELAGDLVEKIVKAKRVRGRWVVCDEGLGDDFGLLDRFASLGLWYLAEVPKDTLVWPLVEPDGSPRPGPVTWVKPQQPSRKGPVPRRRRVHPDSPTKSALETFAEEVPEANWRRFRMLEGAKGPLVCDVVALRAVTARGKLPGPEVWVLVRRTVAGFGAEQEPKYKFYLSNAPLETPLAELVRVCGMRWPIESCFEEGKGELGLDHYELRFWRGWHHHMTLVILAHHFLVRLQRRLAQREGGVKAAGQAPGGSGADDLNRAGRTAQRGGTGAEPAANSRAEAQPGRGAAAASRVVTPTGVRPGGGAEPAQLSAATQGRLLPLPSQAKATPLGGAAA